MSTKFSFTMKRLGDLQPSAKAVYVWDEGCKGLGLRVFPSGVKTFYFRYKTKGQTKFDKIGQFPDVKVDKAREKADERRGKVRLGEDPVAARRKERQALTMVQLWERYLERHAMPKKRERSRKSDEQNWKNHVVSRLGSVPVAAVTHHDIAELHGDLGKSTPGTANRVVALLSKMFSLAIKWGVREDGINPAKGVDKFPERKMKTYLVPKQYGEIFEIIDVRERGGLVPDVVADAIRVIALTGMRASEPLTIVRSGVNIKRGTVHVMDKTNGLEGREVLLSPAALKIVKRRLAAASSADDAPLFHALTSKDAPLNYHVMHKFWEDVRKDFGNTKLRMHDLRHSFASVGADQGLSLQQVGELLGHKSTLTTARYAHLYDSKKREAVAVVGAAIAPRRGRARRTNA